ncbi:MAG: hypothetical protein ABSF65_05605 [Candidatus Bathyarchaeia archaeon]|jgi:hypothetical protein
MGDNACYKMGARDQMGYNYEILEVLPKLIEVGFGEYIVYHNPVDYFKWAHTRTVGVDMEMQVGDCRLCIEMSYCSKNYYYRRAWFTKCRLTRFRNCPKPDSHTYWILLTNRPENFNPVKEIAEQFSICIVGIDELMELIINLKSNNNLTTVVTNQLAVVNYQVK